MNIKDMVKNPHLIHRRYSPFWYFLLQSYEGGIDYSNSMLLQTGNTPGVMDQMWNYFVNGVQQNSQTVHGNLFMHPKERTEDYNRRINMSYYYNFCSPIIDIYSDHLFKQAVIEDFKEIQTTIDIVGEDIDQQGSSIQEFRKNMADAAQIYGHCYVIIDSPSISLTEEVVTRADQIEKRAFPYLTIYSPNNVINWALDEFGSPYWVLVRETYDGNADPKEYSAKATSECYYRLWTRTEWFLYDDDYELEAQGTHEVGEVPIVCVFDKKSKKARNFLGISSIADISFIARDIYNASSELRQILRDQTFSFLAIQGSSDEYSAIDLGTGKGLLYPQDRNVPQYVSPPSDNATVYFDHIDRQIAKIFQLAKIEAGQAGTAKASPAGGASVDTQSGVSKAWSFNQTNSSLSSKSSNLEDAERKIWTIFAKWEGKTFTGSIVYPNEFSITSLMDDLKEAQEEASMSLGKTFKAEVLKSLVRKRFPLKSDAEIFIMEKEIDEANNQIEQQGKPPLSMSQRLAMFSKTTATGGIKTGSEQ